MISDPPAIPPYPQSTFRRGYQLLAEFFICSGFLKLGRTIFFFSFGINPFRIFFFKPTRIAVGLFFIPYLYYQQFFPLINLFFRFFFASKHIKQYAITMWKRYFLR